MRAIEKFTQEMDALEYLHAGTIFAYDKARGRLEQEIDSGELSLDRPIQHTLSKDYSKNIANPNTPELKRLFKKTYPAYLREVIFVRVISTLEVFLVDRYREIFTARPELFGKQDVKVEFTTAHILAFRSVSEIASELINKECRALNKDGFEGILKAYRSRLQIELSDSPLDINRLKESHDRRHLLVHRLGYTDKLYKHKYSASDDRVDVSRDYLIECFGSVREYAAYVIRTTEVLFRRIEAFPIIPPAVIAVIRLKINDSQGAAAIVPTQLFLHGETTVAIGDILHSFEYDNLIYTIRLKSHRKIVDSYVNFVERLQYECHLEIIDTQYFRQTKTDLLSAESIRLIKKRMQDQAGVSSDNITSIAEDLNMTTKQVKSGLKILRELDEADPLLEEVEGSIPLEPWERNFHKTLAQQLDISNVAAYRILLKIRLKRILQ